MINNPQKTVYLAGPITGLTYDEAVTWREVAQKALPDWVACRSPMRYKEYLKNKGKLDAFAHPTDSPFSTSKAIFTRDKNDVRTSDLLLVNFLGATEKSIGTIAEISLAHAWDKPIVVAMEAHGNPHDHIFIHEMVGFRVQTLSDALLVACGVLATSRTNE